MSTALRAPLECLLSLQKIGSELKKQFTELDVNHDGRIDKVVTSQSMSRSNVANGEPTLSLQPGGIQRPAEEQGVQAPGLFESRV